MTDVFLSYSSKDRPAAERVEAALAVRGIDVFWDQETPPGVDWDAWIRNKLAGCKAAVVLWSRESIKSPNVRHEAIVARDAGKLVPAMIEALTPEDFPMGLYLVQGVQLQDWRDGKSKGMARLVAEVEARLGKPAHTAPRTPLASKDAGNGRMLMVGVAVLAITVAGGAWWITQQGKAGAGPALETADAGTRQESAAKGEMFSKRMVGHWNWDGVACADGPNVTLEGGQLVFTTAGARFVHAIETDAGEETHTRVLEPDYVLGEQYVLTPEFNATKDVRSFNLVVKNLTTGGKPDTWSPCEP